MKNKYIIPIFVPHRGCNNQCVFCNQRKISGELKDLTATEVEQTIEQYLKKNSDVCYTNIQVAFYGGSFTGIEKEKQIEFLEVAKKYIDNKKIDSIRLSTRPDYINEEILAYLKIYGVKTIELGVQSLDDKVLLSSKRGHTSQIVGISARLIKHFGFELGLQMMIGLPNSNEELEYKTAKLIIDMQPNIVRIYPTLVIKDTQLEEMYKNKEYIPYTLEQSIDICTKLVQMFEQNSITVIRTGLQTTDNINEGKDVVAGPFHPSFGELVRQRIIRNKVEEYLKSNNVKSLVIKCNKKDISKIIGNKRSNIIYLQEKYNACITLKQDNCIELRRFKVFFIKNFKNRKV